MAITSTTQDQQPSIDGQSKDGCEPIEMFDHTKDGVFIQIAGAGLSQAEATLDGCVFMTGYDRALRVAERINVGGNRINGAPSHGLGDIPFGGNEDSDIGRKSIKANIEEFIRYKNIVL